MEWTHSGYTLCGGSIYNENVIISAAHCCKVFEMPETGIKDFRIVAGNLKSASISDGTEQYRYINDYLIHPDFDEATLLNDICLVYLEEPLNFASEFVQPINITKDEPVQGPCQISGWGTEVLR